MLYEFQKLLNVNNSANEDRKGKCDLSVSGKKYSYI